MLQQENKDETNRVRQGVTGHNVWAVLTLGVAGAVVAFMLAYWLILAR